MNLPGQNKLHFKRFLESILAKTTKLKSLRKELHDNYTAESIKT